MVEKHEVRNSDAKFQFLLFSYNMACKAFVCGATVPKNAENLIYTTRDKITSRMKVQHIHRIIELLQPKIKLPQIKIYILM
jgi:hypothetical protein